MIGARPIAANSEVTNRAGYELVGELGMFMYVFGNIDAGKVSC